MATAWQRKGSFALKQSYLTIPGLSDSRRPICEYQYVSSSAWTISKSSNTIQILQETRLWCRSGQICWCKQAAHCYKRTSIPRYPQDRGCELHWPSNGDSRAARLHLLHFTVGPLIASTDGSADSFPDATTSSNQLQPLFSLKLGLSKQSATLAQDMV